MKKKKSRRLYLKLEVLLGCLEFPMRGKFDEAKAQKLQVEITINMLAKVCIEVFLFNIYVQTIEYTRNKTFQW